MIYNCARGTAQKNLDIEKFKSIKIYIPSLSKQLELITYLNFNHDLIKQLEKEISNNKEQAKQFLSSIVKINNDLNTVSESDTDIKLDTDIKTNSESDSESDSELIEPIIKTKKTKNKNA
jgi:restriction endonuclease S subunit